jgi:hypothetical protein
MGNSPVDRDLEYMYRTWGTTNLITDYWTKPQKKVKKEERTIQEIMHDDIQKGQSYLEE